MNNLLTYIEYSVAGAFEVMADYRKRPEFYGHNIKIQKGLNIRKNTGLHMCIQTTASVYHPDIECTSSMVQILLIFLGISTLLQYSIT